MSTEERLKFLEKQKEIVSESIKSDVNEVINDDIIPTNKKGKYTPNQVHEMISSGEYRVLANKIYRVASAGALRKTIRSKLGISASLWHDMMQLPDSAFPGDSKNIYKQALTKGEINGCYVVVDALKENALGYDYTERNIKKVKGVVISESIFEKHQAANVKAQIHYLGKKLPDEWGVLDGAIINNDNRQININDIQDMPKELRDLFMKFLESKNKDVEEVKESLEIIDVG